MTRHNYWFLTFHFRVKSNALICCTSTVVSLTKDLDAYYKLHSVHDSNKQISITPPPKFLYKTLASPRLPSTIDVDRSLRPWHCDQSYTAWYFLCFQTNKNDILLDEKQSNYMYLSRLLLNTIKLQGVNHAFCLSKESFH